MSMVTHEVAHNIYTNFDVLQDKHIDTMNSFLGRIFNTLEDDSVDYLNGEVYYGDKIIRSGVLDRVIDSLTSKIADAVAKATDPEQQENMQRIATLLSAEMVWRSDYVPSLGRFKDEFGKLLDKSHLEQRDKLLDLFLDRVREGRTDGPDGTSCRYETSRDIYREIFGEDPDQEEQRMEQLHKSQSVGGKEGSGDAKEGKGKSAGSKQGKGEGPPVESDMDKMNWSEFGTESVPLCLNGMKQGGVVVEYKEIGRAHV